MIIIARKLLTSIWYDFIKLFFFFSVSCQINLWSWSIFYHLTDADHIIIMCIYWLQVHHLIEECIVFNMGKEECMDALFKHANIKPIITSTGTHIIDRYMVVWYNSNLWKIRVGELIKFAVWKELAKENKEFFEAYERRREEIPTEKETARRIRDLLSRTTI